MTRQTTGAEAQRGSAKLGPSDPQSTDQGVRENIYNRILNLLDENHVHGDLCREDLTDAILSLKQGGGLKELADEMAQHQRRLANSERPSEVALWLDLNRVETHIRSFLAKPSDSGDAP